MRRLAIPADQQRVYDIYMHPDVVPYRFRPHAT